MFALILRALLSTCQSRSQLLLENLALRHQLSVLQRTALKPRFKASDRLLWLVLRRLLSSWEKALPLVRPQTVIRWHRLGFRLFWR